jgi:sec-independent protein translocase protein TatA
MMPSMQELLVIFGILLLLFGGSRLPGIAAGIGGAVHSFKKSLKGEDDRSLPASNPADRVPSSSTSDTTKSV